MFRVKLREVLAAVKSNSPEVACGVGIAIGSFAVVFGGAAAGLCWWSFLLGFVAAGVTLYLSFRDRAGCTTASRDEWHRLTCERQRADTECARWMARRARLECRRLRRELREQGWQGER